MLSVGNSLKICYVLENTALLIYVTHHKKRDLMGIGKNIDPAGQPALSAGRDS